MNELHDIMWTRRANIFLCRIRMGNCDQRYNLYEKGMVYTKMCDCNEEVETIEHYLTECRLYDDERDEAWEKIPRENWTTNNILWHN